MSKPDPAAPTGRVPVLNIANILTISRIAMVPLFVALMLQDGVWWRLAAFAVFVVAAITDRVDGELARRRNLVTNFGKVADPIADKALTGAALVLLSWTGDLWWWVTIVILAREWGITALRFAVIRHGVIPASRGGKLKTVLQIVAISVYLFPLPDQWYLQYPAHAVMAAAVAVTLWTGADYVAKALRLRRQARAGHPDGSGEG
ncbi:CDP-diacylglycerol--glycerol-3-phosphate 3-phosphatidyltransferase [Thermobifida halotolerans]|uniref:CDP-diacylglycerol--glycerol-3-phosphate 3-phosphatidyltransferase n=1 Tax=Thermobifida halotolerans TaxID=483545 RepID=A0A399G0B6_9ACTN|nr:CDP-diacylglycerol--glycerol-3-phosphate 3-phosphatidyltransferase [Thermobifida halotolerans]UOE19889.1 CDP-diacylglycerol--glycerol-3-phosphate 3-phosphatidyltransferase [Thermobifida halotolerans]